jgi:O-antigen/teichoic acid export membrane protein
VKKLFRYKENKTLKISKFIKDLFATGLTQILVLFLSIILLRVMATALSKEYFGIFMIIRRIIAVGAPLITLNLGVGLARYVSYEREKEQEFLNASLWVISGLSLLVIIISVIFRNQLSQIFFNTSNYSLFVVITAFFLFSYGVYSLSYAFFRGKQEMNRANRMQVFYYLFPVIVGLVLWQLFTTQYSKILSFYLFFFSAWGIILGTVYIRWQKVHFGPLLASVREIQSVKAFFFYSLSRIPSGFFLALVFGIPVFVASHKISLVAAGYVGITVAVVRLMEVFATPFNLLFLPKFAEIKRNNVRGEISDKVSIVISFIFTALLFFAVASYGLAEYVVIIFFGSKYIQSVQGVSLIILFSFFYISYVLIRGILDGLFSFPYVNIICLAGLSITAITSFLFHGSVLELVLDFGLGLLVIGVTTLCVLIKKVNVSVQFNDVLLSLIIILSVFILLLFFDKWSEFITFNEYVKFGVKILYRAILLLAVFWFYWKPKSLWVSEVLDRTRI